MVCCALVIKIGDYAKFLSTQAKDKSEYYEHSEIGYNYRLSNMRCDRSWALEILDDIIQIKRNISSLQRATDILVDYCASLDFFHTRWLSVSLMKNSESVKIYRDPLSVIRNERSWKPMHSALIFKDGVLQ